MLLFSAVFWLLIILLSPDYDYYLVTVSTSSITIILGIYFLICGLGKLKMRGEQYILIPVSLLTSFIMSVGLSFMLPADPVTHIRDILTPCTDGYKQLTFDNDIARFSFEYPCDWEFEVIKPQWGGSDIFTVEAPYLKRDKLPILSTWWVFETSNWGYAAEALDNEVSRWDDMPDFKVLERNEVEIIGVPAEQAVLFFRSRISQYTKETEPVIHREIAFKYGGFTWEIHARSNQEVAEAHKAHFEHMLETFKILK